MSAAESSEVERVATVTALPSRETPTPAAAVPALPSRAQIAEFITPPDIWSDDRPSLRKVWLYARYGRWTHADGVLRVLGAIDSLLLVLPVTAAGYFLLWIWERPARRWTAAVLGGFTYLTLH